MSNTIKEILQLHWMDGAKLSGGSYAKEPSLSADEALAEIERLLEEANPTKPNNLGVMMVQQPYLNACNEYSANIKRILK